MQRATPILAASLTIAVRRSWSLHPWWRFAIQGFLLLRAGGHADFEHLTRRPPALPATLYRPYPPPVARLRTGRSVELFGKAPIKRVLVPLGRGCRPPWSAPRLSFSKMCKSGAHRRKAASGGPEFSLCPGLRVVRFQGRSICGVGVIPLGSFPSGTSGGRYPLGAPQSGPSPVHAVARAYAFPSGRGRTGR